MVDFIEYKWPWKNIIIKKNFYTVKDSYLLFIDLKFLLCNA